MDSAVQQSTSFSVCLDALAASPDNTVTSRVGSEATKCSLALFSLKSSLAHCYGCLFMRSPAPDHVPTRTCRRTSTSPDTIFLSTKHTRANTH